MTFRNIALLTLPLALAGCVAVPAPEAYNYPPSDGYYAPADSYDYDYRTTPSYEGYYYARVIFIDSTPYYVDDDRYIRPIPPRLYDHFRRYPYGMSGGRAPVFSRDSEVRDGYPMSRVVYFNNVPYYVENNRVARPLPGQIQERFRYTPVPGNGRPNGDRPIPGQWNNGQHNEPPAYGRDMERNLPPAYGRDREGYGPPPSDRGQERMTPAPSDRGSDQSAQPYGVPRHPSPFVNGGTPAVPSTQDVGQPPSSDNGQTAPAPFDRGAAQGSTNDPRSYGGPRPPSSFGSNGPAMPPNKNASPPGGGQGSTPAPFDRGSGPRAPSSVSNGSPAMPPANSRSVPQPPPGMSPPFKRFGGPNPGGRPVRRPVPNNGSPDQGTSGNGNNGQSHDSGNRHRD